MVFLNVGLRCNWGGERGGKWLYMCIWGSVPPREKNSKDKYFPKNIFKGKLFNGPDAYLHWWFLYQEIKNGARKPEVVSFRQRDCIWTIPWVDYFPGRQVEFHYCHSDQNSSWCHIWRWQRKSTTTKLNLTSCSIV